MFPFHSSTRHFLSVLSWGSTLELDLQVALWDGCSGDQPARVLSYAGTLANKAMHLTGIHRNQDGDG